MKKRIRLKIFILFFHLFSKSFENNLKHFIHLSPLGISEAKNSDYAKILGENEILKYL